MKDCASPGFDDFMALCHSYSIERFQSKGKYMSEDQLTHQEIKNHVRTTITN